MRNSREVTILMPCAAPAPHLSEALTSIVDQTFDDWQLTLVLDGPAATEHEAARDIIPSQRLNVVQNRVRLGVAMALNRGLSTINSSFVARLDADDCSHPRRLEAQHRFLRENPETVLLGTKANYVDEQSNFLGSVPVKVSSDLRRDLVRRNQVVHSSALFRTDATHCLGGYNPLAHLREDYELWMRMSLLGPVANLGEPLVDYRISSGQVSRRPTTRASLDSVAVAQRALSDHLGLPKARAGLERAAWRAAQSHRGKAVRSLLRPRPYDDGVV